MSLEKLEFGRDWTNPTDFPTKQDSESVVRADMQYHPDAIKDFLNGVLIPALEENGVEEITRTDGSTMKYIRRKEDGGIETSMDGEKWESVPGTGNSVVSFNGRQGIVMPQKGDYTAELVGLGNVDNTSDMDKPVSTAQAEAIAKAVAESGSSSQGNLDAHINNKSNPHGVTAAQSGAVPITRKVNGKALSSDITLSAADVGAYDLSLGKLIPNNADLDTYLELGSYYSTNATATATLKNAPATGAGFKLVVEQGYGASHRIQKAIFNTTGRILWRYAVGSSWTGWLEAYTTGNKPTAADVGAVNQNAVYYGSTAKKNVDDLTDGLALVACSTSLNPELYNLFGTFAYVMTGFSGVSGAETNRFQVAWYYYDASRMAARGYYNGTWSAWKELATTDYALARDGSNTMTGALSFQAVDNGSGRVLKSHSATADYGTYLRDYDKTGAFVSLAVQAANNKASFVDKDGQTYNIYHTGNKPTAADVGAFGVVGEIKSGADLNEYTAMGTYYCNDSTAATIVNCPVTVGFMLEVFSTGTTRVLQLITPTSTSVANRFIYYRKKVGSTWASNWYCLADTDYAVNKAGDTMTGPLVFKPENNGYVNLYKHASAEYDYGVKLEDYSSNGATAMIQLRGAGQTAQLAFRPAGGSFAYHGILHTGNKPSGSYTGTGAAKTINVGGVGSALLVWNAEELTGDDGVKKTRPQMYLVTPFGAVYLTMYWMGSSSIGTDQYWMSHINFTNGVLTFGATHLPYFAK